MKFIIPILLGMFATGCIHESALLAPTHVGLKPSVSVEIDHSNGCATTTKPAIELCIDWNL